MSTEAEELESFVDRLEVLVQKSLDKKNAVDDADLARKWAIVRTDLEKVLAYVRYIEEAE